jgi:NAD dependent epimerase/dehydratase
MDWKGRKVLITGADGFIGSHLTERMVALGADVHALVLYNSFNSWGWLDTIDPAMKSAMTVHAGDVRDEGFLRTISKGMHTVFHLAALIAIPYSYHAPSSYVQTNVVGTLNVLQAAREAGVERLVHTSTSETYGTALYVPIDEKHPLQGQSPYSASKIGADMLAESFHRSFGLPVATIRPFNTYGPRQSARAVIPTVIVQALSGGSTIHLGSLRPLRDMNFVKDTVEGFVKIAESDACIGKVTNVGSGREVSIGDLAHTILRLCGSKAEIVSEAERVRPENSEVERLQCDATLARLRAGWTPAYTLEQGLAETVEWMRGNLDRYKPGQYNL